MGNWMKTEARVRDFVADNFLFGDHRGLDVDSSFLQSGLLGADGLQELAAFIGEEFSIVVDDSDLIPENLDSIARLTAFIGRKKGEVPLGF